MEDNCCSYSLGEIKRAKELGRKGKGFYAWVKCPRCNQKFWQLKPDIGRICKKCADKQNLGKRGIESPGWKGGVYQRRDGYRFVTVEPSSFYVSMAMKDKDGEHYEIAEHRLIMAQSLGRPLKSWELVHHINRDKSDNRLENLKLVIGNHGHLPYIFLEQQISKLEARVTELEAENVLLEFQLGKSVGEV